MRAANALRGEVALVLDGVEWRLRPSFEALVAAEAELGSLFALIERAGLGDVRLGEMAALFWHCLAERDQERKAFEAMLASAGMSVLLGTYRTLLARMFGGAG